MALVDLPPELIQAIINEAISLVGLCQAVKLRPVSKLFERVVLDAIYNGPYIRRAAATEASKLPKEMIAHFLAYKYKRCREEESSVLNIIQRSAELLPGGGVLINEEVRETRVYALCHAIATWRWPKDAVSSFEGLDVSYLGCSSYEADYRYGALIASAATGDLGATTDWIEELEESKDWVLQAEIFGTPLFAAAASGQYHTTKLLLEHPFHGRDISCMTDTKLTPFHLTCSGGHLKVVQLFMDPVYKLERSGKLFEQGLHLAINAQYWDVAKYLLKVSDCTYPWLFQRQMFVEAAITGACDILTEMLDYSGVDINTPVPYYNEPFSCQTAIGCAAIRGHEDAVRLLISKSSSREHYGYGNALVGAVRYGHEAIVDLLLDEGVDINHVTTGSHDWGMKVDTAISASCRSLRPEMLQLLLDRGADVDAGGKGAASLLLACKRGSASIVRILIKAGVDPNGYRSTQSRRSVPLLTALKRGCQDVAVALIELGATDINPITYESG